MQESHPDATADFAARLDHLWKTVYPLSQGRPYTYDEAAREITAAGCQVTGAYLQMLRYGKRTDPKMSYVEGIAKFFGVPAAYFFNDQVASEIDNQLADLAEMRDNLQRSQAVKPGASQAFALRADGLSPESLDTILRLLDQTRKLEGLPPAGPPQTERPS